MKNKPAFVSGALLSVLVFVSAGCPSKPDNDHVVVTKPVIRYAVTSVDRENYLALLEDEKCNGVLIIFPHARYMNIFTQSVRVNLYYLKDDFSAAESAELLARPYLEPKDIVGENSKGEYRYALLLKGNLAYSKDVEDLIRSEAPKQKVEEMPYVQIDNVKISLEICETDDKRYRGLMYRDKLTKDDGMIFIYPEAGERSFWMKNTRMPLSVAFVDEQSKICNIEDMQPFDLNGHKSAAFSRIAIEAPQGYYARLGIKAGAAVTFSDSLKSFVAK